MPVDQTTTTNITCDNPDCPGNDLDPADRMGWTFTSVEVYGEPTAPPKVFCSADCAATFTTAVAAGTESWTPEVEAPA